MTKLARFSCPQKSYETKPIYVGSRGILYFQSVWINCLLLYKDCISLHDVARYESEGHTTIDCRVLTIIHCTSLQLCAAGTHAVVTNCVQFGSNTGTKSAHLASPRDISSIFPTILWHFVKVRISVHSWKIMETRLWKCRVALFFQE